jgi:hypothetical protein
MAKDTEVMMFMRSMRGRFYLAMEQSGVLRRVMFIVVLGILAVTILSGA